MVFSKHTPCPTPFSDHVVKSPHGVDVGLRLWPAEGEKGAPWFFWIHGGGMTAGYKERGSTWMHTAFGSWHIVSVAYRFAPQVTMLEQIQDVTDAWTWCHTHLPTILGEGSIDLASSVVSGDSAGGYHAIMAGLNFSPAPKVIVPWYGVADWLDPAFGVLSAPSPLPPTTEGSIVPPVGVDKFKWYADRPEEEYKAALIARDPSKARTFQPWWWDLDAPLEDLRSWLGLPNYTPTEEHYFYMDLYKYGAKTKSRFPSTHRRDTFATDDEYIEYIRTINPIDLLKQKKTYPATILLHGDMDKAVPVSQSKIFAAALKEKGVPVELVICPGGGHSFDENIHNPGDDGWDEYVGAMLAFVDKQIPQ